MCLMEFSGGGLWRGFLEGVCGGVSGGGLSGRLWRLFEEVSGGGLWRGYLEGVSRDISGGLSRRSLEGVSGGGL